MGINIASLLGLLSPNAAATASRLVNPAGMDQGAFDARFGGTGAGTGGGLLAAMMQPQMPFSPELASATPTAGVRQPMPAPAGIDPTATAGVPQRARPAGGLLAHMGDMMGDPSGPGDRPGGLLARSVPASASASPNRAYPQGPQSGQPQGSPQMGYQQPQGFGGFLQNLFDPQAKGRNETISWLQTKGYDPGTAAFIAGDKETLRGVLRETMQGRQPDLQMQTIYDKRGNETKVLMDMRTGSYQPIGGAKSDLLSPDVEAQKLRIAGAGASNVNVGSEKGYDKSVGEGYAKRFLAIQDEAQAAGGAINALRVMGQSMAQPGFYSGSGANVVQMAKRFGAALGIDAEGVRDMETFNAMSKQAALASMGGSLGTGFSNADRDFVIDQVPNLANTPEGNRRLIEIQTKLAERKQQIAQQARTYAAQNGGRIDAGFDDYLARWADRNPLFPADPSRVTGEPPSRVNNPPRPRGGPQGAPQGGPQRAHNPTTGRMIEWNGTQWVPVR